MRPGLLHRRLPLHRWCAALRADEGAGTVYALFVVSLSLMLGGLAIDTVNAWRARAELSVVADAAAHAGAVALAQDMEPDAVRTAVEAILVANGANGPGAAGARNPVAFLTYDPAQNRVQRVADSTTTPNAVALQIRYDATDHTALPTYFLGMIGIQSWNLQRSAVAALVPPSHCPEGDVVLSRDLLQGEGKLTLGQGTCLHAQKRMEFLRPPEISPDAWLSLPNLAGCGAGCAELLALPTSRAQMSALNFLQPDYRAHIDRLTEAFQDKASDDPLRRAFFAARPLSKNLSALAEVGIIVDDLKTGAVVDLTATQVRLARHLPQGLVYRVSCAEESQETFLMLGSPGPTITGSALLTDCPIVVSRAGGLTRALILSTWKGIAGVDLPGIEVMARGSHGTCRSSRSVLMAYQPIYLLPGASGDALGLVSASDVAIFPPSEEAPNAEHHGLSIYAGSTAYIEGDHRFEACGVQDADGLLPQMRLIRQVMPSNIDDIYPAGPKASRGPHRAGPRKHGPAAPGNDELVAALP